MNRDLKVKIMEAEINEILRTRTLNFKLVNRLLKNIFKISSKVRNFVFLIIIFNFSLTLY